MADIRDTKKVLDEINAAVSSYDPTLKEQARDILLKQAFGVEAKQQNAPKLTSVNAPSHAEKAEAAFHVLVEKWTPETQTEWALLGAYYFQVSLGNQNVSALQVNNALKQHGQNLSNITVSFEENIKAEPALMRQTAKAGTTKQAKKKYVVTTSGVRFVTDKLKGVSK